MHFTEYPYQFVHIKRHELQDVDTFEQLRHLELLDRVLCMPSLAKVDLAWEVLTDDDLLHLLGRGDKPVTIEPPRPVVPREPIPQRALGPRYPAPPRVKAQIWWQGKNHDLGWYLTEIVRDEVVAEARRLRAMGLDPRMARKTKHH